MRLGCHTITWGGVTGDPTGVTSVKDLVYRVPGSMPRALRDIAAAGYEGVELFDGNLADFAAEPQRLRDLLGENSLTLASVYTGANFIYSELLPDELHRVRRAAELAATFGAEHLVVGGGARRASGTRDDDYDRLGEALDTVAELAEERGLTACYHPHLTTIVESPDEVRRLFSCSRIGFCPDTAHLVAGGGDPAQLIREHRDRVRHVHLKDVRDGRFLPLGQGEVDFDDVFAALREIGYDGWLFVELDYYDGDPAEAARISKSYLDGRIEAVTTR
ncbi:sugar phosphate isomerase/epimerase [Amycolatopsis sp. FU40]|uniref:sugar phosphate isomerase/epimerase family protein n=1 Tax=Amycolatopsis sp. FU40 TaxID=2914159 RepID=UPI001F244B0C|nr:sugar phosphate isomerase/epimerase family protein [Amycolatopsis sp. FU40]UKD57048.1 sugar phosphate isomerase/epimerase [Amycolatopsis sp. FU40]